MDLEINFFTKNKVFPMVIRDALPTCEFLITKRLEITNMCHLCKRNIENIDHIFKYCPFVQGIWDHIKYNCPTRIFYDGDFLSWLKTIYKNYKINCKIYKHSMEKNFHYLVEYMDS